ncbi:MAG: HD domain-containing phosphohydrolase [Nitrospirota bacterium]
MEAGKILIVDDDPVIRSLLSDLLESSGDYCIEIARDGREGIDKVRDQEYDVVFTDLSMPQVTGIDFIKEAKKIRPELSVVVITGHGTTENAVDAMREGAADFITKPFTRSSVASIAERTIGEKKILNRMQTNDNAGATAGLSRKVQEISILQTIHDELDDLSDNGMLYDRMVEMASRLLPVREISFGIIENGRIEIKSSSGVLEQTVSVSNPIFEQVIRTRKHCIAAGNGTNPHTGLPLTAQFFSIPLMMHEEIFGILNFCGKTDQTALTHDEIALALLFARKAAQRIENNALYEVFYQTLMNTLKSLVTSVEARDPYIQRHSERVTRYALQIADVMHLPAEEKDAIGFGGYLHDIGKIGVRDTVLLKPSKLTPEEFSEIKLHPVIGDTIIKPIRFFPKEREIILYHHEHFDGSGYPAGLAGQAIPLTARVLSVADTYDAMTSVRPYRGALSHETAIAELLRCCHTQFDEDVVRAFLQTSAGKGQGHGTETGR